MKLFDLPYCEECGGARVAHGPEKFSLILEEAISSFLGGERSRAVERAADRLAARMISQKQKDALVRMILKARLGRIEPYEPNGNTRALALKEGADALGITLSTFALFGVPLTHIAEHGEARTHFNLIPRPNTPRSPAFYFMDNKAELKKLLQGANIPTAKGGAARTLKEAKQLFIEIGKPVITKPHCGSRGRHTTIDIRNAEALERGFNIAKALSPQVIVEQYLKGVVHRVTLVGGKVAAVAKREYPYVIGDGTHTIAELIEIENQNPRRDGTFFKPLEKTARLDNVLREQGFTADDTPNAEVRVYVNDKNSRLNGTVTDDVTDKVHPENIALFERIGAVLDDPIVGVDFMIPDVTLAWHAQEDVGVLECNSMPFIDVHHKVASGKPRNVAKLLWEEVFR